MTTTAKDVRTIAPRKRHPLDFTTPRESAPGAATARVNGDDPRSLDPQFSAAGCGGGYGGR
jgi:uncharacterized protein (DUF2249 family)